MLILFVITTCLFIKSSLSSILYGVSKSGIFFLPNKKKNGIPFLIPQMEYLDSGTTLAFQRLNLLYHIKHKKKYIFLKNINGTSKDRKSTRLNSSHVSLSYAVF